MTAGHQIQYLQKIDKKKWDDCIDKAPNGLIYAYSFYLDALAKHWDALVLNNYEAVMPLTWNRKYGFYYLYHPAFAASLGVFGKNLTEKIVQDFIKAIPQKFKLIEISLNSGNIFSTPSGFSLHRSNYVLNLNKSYDELYKAYRENHKRNISKAAHAGCAVSKNISVEDIIRLNKEQLKNISGTKPEDYTNFKKLYVLLKSRKQAEAYAVVDTRNNILASCIFFFSHNRGYYILVGNQSGGKTFGASHALIDAFIKDHAGENLILDFEGSDIPNLALFYSGFGASEEVYPALRINRLPWYIRWLKK